MLRTIRGQKTPGLFTIATSAALIKNMEAVLLKQQNWVDMITYNACAQVFLCTYYTHNSTFHLSISFFNCTDFCRFTSTMNVKYKSYVDFSIFLFQLLDCVSDHCVSDLYIMLFISRKTFCRLQWFTTFIQNVTNSWKWIQLRCLLCKS